MLNGMFLHSYPLVSWSLNPFGRHDGLAEHDVELPSWVLKEQNVLSVYFNVRARNGGGEGLPSVRSGLIRPRQSTCRHRGIWRSCPV